MKKFLTSYWIRSAFYTFLQRFSLTIFGLINFMILIRSLSKAEMGTWALFLTITTIFEATKSALLKNAHIKYVSGDINNEQKTTIASSSLLINALLSIVFIVFILFFSKWLSQLLNAGILLSDMLTWFIPGLICMIFFSHFEAIQQSHFDFKGVFAGQLVRQLTFFGVIFLHLIFKIPFSLKHLALYQSLGIALGTIAIYLYSRKYLLHKFDPTTLWTQKMLGYGGFIFGSGIVSNVFSNLDQIMTASYLSTSSVAYYNAATRINGFIDIPSYAASEILFPKMSKASADEGVEKVKYLYERMVSLLVSFTIPAAIIIIIFPKWVIGLIAGTQYYAAAPILQLYMITSILGPLQNQGANTLNSIGKPALCFGVNTISLVTKLIITYICLKNLGFYGPAISTLITSVLSCLLWSYVMKREIGAKISGIGNYILEFYKTAYPNFIKIITERNKT